MAGRYSDYLYYDGTNTPLANTNVSVYVTDTTTLATLFTSDDVPTTNPVQTDLDGFFEFYALQGVYDIWVAGTKYAVVSVNEPTIAGGVVVSGDITFDGTGRRFYADFSNSTMGNRLIFQDATADHNTVVSCMPNGTATIGIFRAYNGSTPDTTSSAEIRCDSTASYITSNGKAGAAPWLPLTFHADNAEGMRITASGTTTSSSTPHVLIGGTVDNGTGTSLQVTGGLSASGMFKFTSNAAPATAASSGTAGEIRIDSGYIYICVATDTWKRAAISTW